MTARVGRGITATADHRHPHHRRSDHDLPLSCPAMVAEHFRTALRHEQPGPHLFGLVMRGMEGTLTVMAMVWAANDLFSIR